jgi:hypothetical protein
MKTKFALAGFIVVLVAGVAVVAYGQRGGRGGGGDGGHTGGFGGGRAGGSVGRGSVGEARGGFVQRSDHGSIRHGETHITRAPEFRSGRGFEGGPNRGGFYVHNDPHIDIGGHHYWHDFRRGAIIGSLPFGYLSFNIGGLPYYYYGGIYYQQGPGGYQEVYPPTGAALPAPPEGAYPVAYDGQTLYYAGGAFYAQQPDGTFTSVPPPMGVIVPELPPGAVQVNVNGTIAYQFNGIYYEPVFANGVTQYQTIAP